MAKKPAHMTERQVEVRVRGFIVVIPDGALAPIRNPGPSSKA